MTASVEDLVRGFLAVWLVLVLMALVFFAPTPDNTPAIASAKTLTIAVIAFYFGLHKGTPHNPRIAERRENTTQTDSYETE